MFNLLSIGISNFYFRYVIVSAKDLDKTPPSKLAHMMPCLEIFGCSPPAILLICLKVNPTCFELYANICPEVRILNFVQEKISEGFIPLIQVIKL